MLEARVAPTPKDTVFRDGRGSLYRFRGGRAAGTHVPLLLVPSMISRWYVLDLREGASLARALSAGAPWDTFCFDWGVPEDEDRYVTWDDVVARLERIVRRVLRVTGAPRVALLGSSMGATLAAIVAARAPSRVGALVNVTGPFDFGAGDVATLVDPRWFDARAVTAAGNVPGHLLYGGIQALSPTSTLARWVRWTDALDDPSAQAELAALERLANDQVALPGAAYATYIEELYQQNRLVRGEHVVRGERVDLARITCPVLSVYAERDALCPRAAVTALNEHVSSEVKDVLGVPGGHVGSIVGASAATELYPRLRAWLEAYGVLSS